MIVSLTAAAGHRFSGRVVADTSVIPTAKTSITNKPLAEKVDGKVPERATGKVGAKGSGGIKPAGVVDNSNTVKKNTATTVKKNSTPKTASSVKNTTSVKKTIEPAEKNVNKTSTANTKTGVTNKSSVKSAVKKNTAAEPDASVKSNTSSKKNVIAGKKLAALTPTETNRAPTKSSKTKSRKLRKGIGIELYPPLAFKYAILLDVPVEKVTDGKLLEVLDHWYGTRYRYGGETRRGIDCSAFTQAFMLSYFDYDLPRTAEEQYTICKHIKKRKLRQGDLVFFKTNGPKGGITHVGVYLVNNRFVHSATSTGVRISDLNDDYYKEKYAGAGRIR